MSQAPTDVAIVHDYLTQKGGAERVVLSMLEAFPEAPLYTSVYDPDATFPEFRDHDVRTLWTNKVPGLRRDHRRGLLIYPHAFSSLTVKADVTLCSSSGFAHGVKTTGRKIVYCYTPARLLYSEADAYLTAWSTPVRRLARAVRGPLRSWDRRAAETADQFITTSTVVRERIRKTYGREATVLAPPVHVDISGSQRPLTAVEPGFLLSVCRLLPYKNVDTVVEAMAELTSSRLVIVGTGPDRDRLQEMAGTNVIFAGEIDDAELRWCYANCAGLVAASFEDYGLTPVEAAAYGKPSVVLRRGGFLDTVSEAQTGILVNDLTPAAFARGIERMLEHPWDQETLMEHARAHSFSRFSIRLHALVLQPIHDEP